MNVSRQTYLLIIAYVMADIDMETSPKIIAPLLTV